MSYAFKGSMFDRMPVPALPKNTFDLSHQRLFTAEQGLLIPCFFQPVNPNDTWRMSLSSFVRMMPMYAPIMHQIDVSFYAFYMRENQLWKSFDDFIRGGDDGFTDYDKPNIGKEVFASGDTSEMSRFYRIMNRQDPMDFDDDFADEDRVKPNLTLDQGQHGSLLGVGSLADHLGLPVIDYDKYLEDGLDWFEIYDNWCKADMRPWDIAGFKMYQEIYNEYFRDEYLCEKVETFKDADGDILEGKSYNDELQAMQRYSPYDIQELFKLRHRAWEKDQFTTALQEPVAIPEVLIPFEADVEISELENNSRLYMTNSFRYAGDDIPDGVNQALNLPGGTDDGDTFNYIPSVSADGEGRLHLNSSIPTQSVVNAIQARVSNISATINQLRSRVALQEFYEQQARGGNRIRESIMTNFNSVIPDYRLDVPQYLGGMKFTLSISQVLQTSSSVGSGEDLQALGQMAGQGMSGQSGFMFKEHFPEHGYIMVIASVRPRSMYSQGMSALHQRFNRMDYYWHKLANIGDEPIKNGEVYLDQLARDNRIADETFGYQTRYSHYKYIPNSVHGDFKTTLKDWHLGRFFDETPKLNQDFIEIDAERQGLNRIFNYQGEDYGHFLFQTSFDVQVTRVMEIFSVPRFA